MKRSDPKHIFDKLPVFNKLTDDHIIKLGDFFDESIISKKPDFSEIKKIIGNNFNDEDIFNIVLVFLNFMVYKDRPNFILEIIDNSILGDEKKNITKKAMKNIHDKIDSDVLSTELSCDFLKTFGYPHTHGFTVVTEFRPVSNHNKIQKLIPSLVISIKTHDTGHDKDDLINLQLDLERTKDLIEVLTDGAKILEFEIQEMRNKFGDDAIA